MAATFAEHPFAAHLRALRRSRLRRRMSAGTLVLVFALRGAWLVGVGDGPVLGGAFRRCVRARGAARLGSSSQAFHRCCRACTGQAFAVASPARDHSQGRGSVSLPEPAKVAEVPKVLSQPAPAAAAPQTADAKVATSEPPAVKPATPPVVFVDQRWMREMSRGLPPEAMR